MGGGGTSLTAAELFFRCDLFRGRDPSPMCSVHKINKLSVAWDLSKGVDIASLGRNFSNAQ